MCTQCPLYVVTLFFHSRHKAENSQRVWIEDPIQLVLKGSLLCLCLCACAPSCKAKRWMWPCVWWRDERKQKKTKKKNKHHCIIWTQSEMSQQGTDVKQLSDCNRIVRTHRNHFHLHCLDNYTVSLSPLITPALLFPHFRSAPLAVIHLMPTYFLSSLSFIPGLFSPSCVCFLFTSQFLFLLKSHTVAQRPRSPW